MKRKRQPPMVHYQFLFAFIPPAPGDIYRTRNDPEWKSVPQDFIGKAQPGVVARMAPVQALR